MEVDKSKLGGVGADKIILNNFTVEQFGKLEKKVIDTQKGYSQLYKEDNEEFILVHHEGINYEKDDFYLNTSLQFNPNKILYGHNIYNSSITDLKKAIDIIIMKLNKIGVKLNLSEANIRVLELNINLELNFLDLEVVLLAVGRANYNRAIAECSFTNSDIPKEIKETRTLYINPKGIRDEKELEKTIKFYDKDFYFLKKYGIELDIPITRAEAVFGRDFYRREMERRGLDNSLKTLLSNKHLFKDLFNKAFTEEMKKADKYINETLKKNLEKEFLRFRRNEVVKRSKRKTLKLKGLQIPKELKEIRGVFEYLHTNSWIFDYSFLVEIVERHIPQKNCNKIKFLNQIEEKFISSKTSENKKLISNENNYEIFKKIHKIFYT